MRMMIVGLLQDRAPFIWMWLHKDSIETITMPLSCFHELADELGPPSTRLILASHPGRVGSTLFCNLVHHLSPEIFSFGSHHSFYVLHHAKQQLDPTSYEKMAQSIIRIAFKPIQGKPIFFTKGACKTIDISADILRHVPNSTHIYLDRNSFKTIQSYERVFTQLLENRLLRLKMMFNWIVRYPFFRFADYHQRAQKAAFEYLRPTQFEMFAMIWASNQLYRREIAARFSTAEFTFEDTVANCTKGSFQITS